MVSCRWLKGNYRTGGIKQGSHQCTCVHILHKNEKTHISLNPRVPGMHNDWSLHPHIFATIFLSTLKIMSTQKTQSSTTKKTQTLSIRHKRKTDVDAQIACLQVQIA